MAKFAFAAVLAVACMLVGGSTTSLAQTRCTNTWAYGKMHTSCTHTPAPVCRYVLWQGKVQRICR
jgi:hypothetical protein